MHNKPNLSTVLLIKLQCKYFITLRILTVLLFHQPLLNVSNVCKKITYRSDLGQKEAKVTSSPKSSASEPSENS